MEWSLCSLQAAKGQTFELQLKTELNLLPAAAFSWQVHGPPFAK